MPNILFSSSLLPIANGGVASSSLFSTPLPSPSIAENSGNGNVNPLSSILNNQLSPFYI